MLYCAICEIFQSILKLCLTHAHLCKVSVLNCKTAGRCQLSLFVRYCFQLIVTHLLCTCGARTAYLPFNPIFVGFVFLHSASSTTVCHFALFLLVIAFSRSYDLRLLITPLVSSNNIFVTDPVV